MCTCGLGNCGKFGGWYKPEFKYVGQQYDL